MICAYCQHESGHDPNCPEVGDEDERRLKRASYHLGWRYGRSGKAYSTTNRGYDPAVARLHLFEIAHPGAWDMGVGNGIVALEEFENSEPPDYG